MKLIFATHNSGKLVEMRKLLADTDVEVLSAEEAGVTEDVIENGATFEENSFLKSRFVASETGEWSVADDSGVCIEALGCRPGVYSARWAGEGADDETMIKYTLNEVKDVPEGQRQAYFETVATLVSPTGEEYIFSGRVNGVLTKEPRGVCEPKLPYDAIFIPEGFDKTFAELGLEIKNTVSHRGKAFEKLKSFLRLLDTSLASDVS